MITYDKVKKLKINSKKLLDKYKYSKKYFTRNRKISCKDIIYFTLYVCQWCETN
mgnify:CR=1 FL=1